MGVRSDVVDNIKRMPDFVVQDKSGEICCVGEVITLGV